MIDFNYNDKFNEIEYCPENCPLMNHSESGQELMYKLTGMRIKHKCLLFNELLYHLGQHPKIHKCKQCLDETTNIKTIK